MAQTTRTDEPMISALKRRTLGSQAAAAMGREAVDNLVNGVTSQLPDTVRWLCGGVPVSKMTSDLARHLKPKNLPGIAGKPMPLGQIGSPAKMAETPSFAELIEKDPTLGERLARMAESPTERHLRRLVEIAEGISADVKAIRDVVEGNRK